MKSVELLAPAGSRESLEAAIKAGADAVYLSGNQFGARKSAANFSVEALREAIEYAHLRNVRVYLTVNTLIADGELPELLRYLDEVYLMGMDAFIVQEMGLIPVLRNRYPAIELHCSTQMALLSAQDVSAMKALGADRVVVPRELAAEEIRTIKDRVEMDLEVFVHGALCVCVSGQCLMSSMIGGRSGNRGNCAQSCRQRYTLKRDNGLAYSGKRGDFLLSPRDLYTLEQIELIVKSGASSLKIEGRMKGPEYTYEVTKAYREALDQWQPERAPFIRERLHDIFSRDFTEGYVLGDGGEALMSHETPGNRGVAVAKVVEYDPRAKELILDLEMDLFKGDDIQIRRRGEITGGRVEYIVKAGGRIESAPAGCRIRINYKHEANSGEILYRTYNASVMKSVRETLHDIERTRDIHAHFMMSVGKPAKLTLSDNQGNNAVVVSEDCAEKANKSPLSQERVAEQLKKMGGTAYRLQNLSMDLDPEGTMPIKIINLMRRTATEALDAAILKRWTDGRTVNAEGYPLEEIRAIDAENDLEQPIELTASARNLEVLQLLLGTGISSLYYLDSDSLEAAAEHISSRGIDAGIKVWASIGRLTRTHELDAGMERLIAIEKTYGKVFYGYLASSPGQLAQLRTLGRPVMADFTFNLFNHLDLEQLSRWGAEGVTLSPELNAEQIKQLLAQRLRADGRLPAIEIIGYGRLPVMVSRYCPISGAFGERSGRCRLCRESDYSLVDKTGAEFPVRGNQQCLVEIFNSVRLNLADEMMAMKAFGINRYRMCFVDETLEEVLSAIDLHRGALMGQTPELKGKGYTKGHFRRGVIEI